MVPKVRFPAAPDRAGWALLGLLVGTTLALAKAFGFGISFAGQWPGLAGVALLGLYVEWRFADDERVRAAYWATVYLVVASLFGAVLSYIAMSAPTPFADASFTAWDRALGFDWHAFMATVDRQPLAVSVLAAVYYSMLWQLIAVILFLGFSRGFDDLARLCKAFVVGVLLTMAVAALMPAEAPFFFYGAKPEDFAHLKIVAGQLHHADVLALRAGTLRDLDPAMLQGIVTFPSFHATFAVLIPWAVRRHLVLLVPALALNALVMISAITEGGHYLIDLPAGMLVAACAILAAHILTRRPVSAPLAGGAPVVPAGAMLQRD